MTTAEARAFLNLKDTDPIHEDGVRFLLSIAETRLKTWSLTNSMRCKITREIEAYKAILNGGK